MRRITVIGREKFIKAAFRPVERRGDIETDAAKARSSHRDEKGLDGLNPAPEILQALTDEYTPRQLFERHPGSIEAVRAPRRTVAERRRCPKRRIMWASPEG